MITLTKLFIKHLRKLILSLEQKQSSSKLENKITINTLAPRILTDKKDIERIKPYLDNLKQAINTESINNIALTGSYGSGKSTILKTFQCLNPQFKYLNISLASFKDNKIKQDDDDRFETKLEISILQQMFYHVQPSVIPDSRFKRIINTTTRTLLIQTSFVIMWIFSSIILFKFKKIDKINPDEWSIHYNMDWITLFSTVIFFTGIGFFVKSLHGLLSNSKISKLNIKGEVELGESIDKSVFNQHLEEILYFFERTEFSVVVIEDVDRFNSTDIFTKLREINILINNSNLIKRKVSFIYAIKDEMFTDKNERVKFFEFIIPVIPFINPSNASDQLAKLISGANLSEVLSSEFTSDVITFIDDIDMRLLINIFQEYQLYKASLSEKLSQDNLFAIIVYKNMFPTDFGNLAKRKGDLYKFLSNRSLYSKDILAELGSNISSIDEQINLIESEFDRPINELRSIYINKIIQKLDRFHSFSINNTSVTLAKAMSDENFDVIKISNNIFYIRYDNIYSLHDVRLSSPLPSGISFESIEKEVFTGLSYNKREKLLSDRSYNQIEKLKKDRERLSIKIAEIESFSIKEIFEQIDIENHLGVFKDNFLMRNLLLNGYIDEHYNDYISLFHEISLTKDDFAFERGVKSGINLGYDYVLTKAEGILKRLPDKYFKRDAILNFTLLECLIENELRYRTKFDNLFKGLSADKERQFQFIQGFINRNTKDLGYFVKKICEYKPSLWKQMNESKLPKEEVEKFLRLIFTFGDNESIIKLNEVDELVKFFEQMDGFFAFCSSMNQTEKIQFFMTHEEILLNRMDLPEHSMKNLFEYVYKNDRYKLNKHNVFIIATYFEKQTEELNTANYSTLLQSGLEDLLSYISNNFEEYLEDVIFQIEGNTLENESAIIDILNMEGLTLDLKTKFISSQASAISLIRKIGNQELRQILLISNKLKPSWINVMDYYDNLEYEDFDDPLIKFLNTNINYEELSKSKLKEDSERNQSYIENISSIIIYCEKLKEPSYNLLLKSIPYTYSTLDYDLLMESQISGLLQGKMLTLSNKNFSGLKAKKSNLHIQLIELYQDEFIKLLAEFNLDANDWILLFKSPIISLQNKIIIIRHLDDSLIIENTELANTTCSILPENEYIPFRFEVLNAMFNAHSSVKKRISILNLYFEHLDDGQIQILTENLGDNYAKIFERQHKPLFINSSHNITLFNKLKERDLIIRFETIEKTDEIRVFAKY